MKSIQKLFPTILILSCFFLICLGSQGVVLAGTIQLPKTGQTTCYDSSGTVIPCAGTRQDGDIQAGVAWPDPRFTVSGDCVSDNLTGLMWAKNANLPSGEETWQGALLYVASMNSGSGLCGHHDWRLPNVNELESLVNSGQPDSASWLNSQGFSNVQSSEYSSSSYFAYDPMLAKIVNMWDGSMYDLNKGSTNYVWPVRSGQGGTIQLPKTGQTKCYNRAGTEISCAGTGQDGDIQAGVAWPDPRFNVSGDCVSDNLTGLMWAKNANLPSGVESWQGALDYVASINSGSGLCGHHDWRLPNRKELFSLIDHSQHDPALPLNHPFNNVQSDNYLSSSSYTSDTRNAWVVLMWAGVLVEGSKSGGEYGGYVWPVRSGQLKPSVITGPATNVTQHLATLNGTVNANNASTTVTFQYGLTTGYGSTVTADQSPVTGNSDTAVSKAISGLTPNATYHGVNLAGTAYGSDMTLKAVIKAMPWLMLLLGN